MVFPGSARGRHSSTDILLRWSKEASHLYLPDPLNIANSENRYPSPHPVGVICL